MSEHIVGKIENLGRSTPIPTNLTESTFLAVENANLRKEIKYLKKCLTVIANKEIVFPDYDWSDWNGHDAQLEATNLIAQYAKLVLTERNEKLDTIKREGRGRNE